MDCPKLDNLRNVIKSNAVYMGRVRGFLVKLKTNHALNSGLDWAPAIDRMISLTDRELKNHNKTLLDNMQCIKKEAL